MIEVSFESAEKGGQEPPEGPERLIESQDRQSALGTWARPARQDP